MMEADVPYAQLPAAIHAVRSRRRVGRARGRARRRRRRRPRRAAAAAHPGGQGPRPLARRRRRRRLRAAPAGRPAGRRRRPLPRIAPKEPDAEGRSTELPKSARSPRRRVEPGAAHAAERGWRPPPLPHRRRVARRRPREDNLAPLVLKGQVRAALKCTPPDELSDDDDDDDDAELTEEAALAAAPPPRRRGSEPPDDDDDDDGEAALARMAAACRATMN